MAYSPAAGRVLGCLVEKQLTTPQQYPLTLNALVSATNQATNRDPVVELDEDAVLAAVDELRTGQLVRVVLPSHGRSVKRYRHVLDEVFGLGAPRYGLLAALLLRGPQTAGELRARTERMLEFVSVEDTHAALTALAGHADGLVRLLPRRPGQKEDRWQQILAAPWGTDVGAGDDPLARGDRDGDRPIDGPPAATASADPPSGAPGLAELRAELTALRAEVAAVRADLDELRRGLGG